MSKVATCAVASQTCSGPMPSASLAPTSCDPTPAIDAHTIPMVFGTIGVILALMAIAVNIAFGILQLCATDKRLEDHECGSRRTPQSTATTRVRSAHQTGRFAAPTNQASCFQQKSQQAGTVGMACGASNALWFVTSYLATRGGVFSLRCRLTLMMCGSVQSTLRVVCTGWARQHSPEPTAVKLSDVLETSLEFLFFCARRSKTGGSF